MKSAAVGFSTLVATRWSAGSSLTRVLEQVARLDVDADPDLLVRELEALEAVGQACRKVDESPSAHIAGRPATSSRSSSGSGGTASAAVGEALRDVVVERAARRSRGCSTPSGTSRHTGLVSMFVQSTEPRRRHDRLRRAVGDRALVVVLGDGERVVAALVGHLDDRVLLPPEDRVRSGVDRRCPVAAVVSASRPASPESDADVSSSPPLHAARPAATTSDEDALVHTRRINGRASDTEVQEAVALVPEGRGRPRAARRPSRRCTPGRTPPCRGRRRGGTRCRRRRHAASSAAITSPMRASLSRTDAAAISEYGPPSCIAASVSVKLHHRKRGNGYVTSR